MKQPPYVSVNFSPPRATPSDSYVVTAGGSDFAQLSFSGVRGFELEKFFERKMQELLDIT